MKHNYYTKYIRIACLFILLFAGNRVFCNTNPVIVRNNIESIPLVEQLYIFQTDNPDITIDDVMSSRQNAEIVFQQAENTNFGFTSKTFWLRFDIIAPPDTSSEWLLELDYPLIDSVEYYLTTDDRIINQEIIGDSVAFRAREVPNCSPLFRLHLSPYENYTVYLKLETQGTMRFPLTVWSSQAFILQKAQSNTIYGLYYGMILLLFLLIVLIFFYQHNKMYFFFAIFLLSIAFFETIQSGILFELILPRNTHWKFITYISAGTIGLLSFSKFVYEFLSLEENGTPVRLIYRSLYGFGFLIIVLTLFLPTAFSIQAFALFGVISIIPNFLAGILTTWKGKRPGIFFLIALAFFLAAIIIFSLRGFGLLPTNFLTLYAKELGFILLTFMLTLGIADRINRFRLKSISSTKELQKLLESSRKFIPEEFFTILEKENISTISLGDNAERSMTVMFVDIRGFTTLSEELLPKEVFAFLNSYLERIGPLIRNNNGFIDKYIGDAVMALFPEDVSDSLNAAIQIQKRIKLFNEERASRGMPHVQIGIGIHTGNLLLGTIGEKERLETTVVSDAVNIASRLEGLTKHFTTPILISQQVIMNLSDPMAYEFRFLGKVIIKGKKQSISVFDVYSGDENETQEKKRLTKDYFEQGLMLYLKKSFVDSRVFFQKVLAYYPEDKAAQIYYKQAGILKQRNLSSTWTGALKFQHK
ncbi:MAG: 7TM-DISM domain-containing protein [Spirochaetia bacterium]